MIFDRWRRTQFISPIVAPDLSRLRLMACLSSSVKPSIGMGSSEEPPPEIRHSTKSSSVRPFTRSSSRRAAARPAASGTGCEASTIVMCLHGTA